MANWGSVVWAAPTGPSLTYQSGYSVTVRSQFASNGKLLDSSDHDLRAPSTTTSRPSRSPSTSAQPQAPPAS